MHLYFLVGLRVHSPHRLIVAHLTLDRLTTFHRITPATSITLSTRFASEVLPSIASESRAVGRVAHRFNRVVVAGRGGVA